MFDAKSKPLNFKKIPKILNISGTSTSTFSVNSTPFSDKTNATSVTNTPSSKNLVNYLPHEYKSPSDKLETTPLHFKHRKQIIPDVYNCSFCNEPLHNTFEGEILVDLNCGHSLHYQCFNEILTPVDFFNINKINTSDEKQIENEIICPSCNIKTFCIDDSLIINMKNNQILQTFDNVFFSKSEMLDVLPTADNVQTFNITSNSDDIEKTLNEKDINININNDDEDDDDDDEEEDPVTPQAQMGMSFWEREDELFAPNISLSNYDTCKNENSSSSFDSDIQLAKVLFAPEFSSINIKKSIESEFGFVLNISTTEFEAPLESNKKEQIKTQVSKNKITNSIINKFNKNLINERIDFSNVGNLILFDTFDIKIKLSPFDSCQVYLYESNLIILNKNGTQLLLNQELNSSIFISSIYEDEASIIINLNSIKLPSLILISNNKILKHKWFIILKKLSKNIPVTNLIPLIQTSTNAWDLLSDDGGNDLDNDVIPEDIKIVKKLTSKGLDLPSKFLKRQILRPDSIPKIIILALPLVNCEDYGLKDSEYAQSIKNVLISVLNSLNSRDKLGIVYFGNHIKNLTSIGNYYGCVGREWNGWSTILESITENVICEEDQNNLASHWESSMKYIKLLSNLAFRKHTNEKTDFLHQIIYVSNEILTDCNPEFSMERTISKENPFLIKRQESPSIEINLQIAKLCEEFSASFDYILLADEFRYEPYQIMSLNKILKQYTTVENNQINNNNYNNKIKLHVALDFDNLLEVLKNKIEDLHKVTIKKLETQIKFPEFVKLKNFESPIGVVDCSKQEIQDNTYSIKLEHLSSGYEKSLLFNLHVDYKNSLINDKSKALFAISNTKLSAENFQSEFCNQMDIKLITNDSIIENGMRLRLAIEKSQTQNISIASNDKQLLFNDSTENKNNLNLSIISKLSSMSDAYFIRRKIQSLVIEKLSESVLHIKNFDSVTKENAKNTITKLINDIWELSTSCDSSNTNNILDKDIEKWSEVLMNKLEDIAEGYSLRNYHLSNMKCVCLFLELE
jgi:hypothetical protein